VVVASGVLLVRLFFLVGHFSRLLATLVSQAVRLLLPLSGLREDGMVSGFMPVIWPVSVMV
jgi:hypothetical protein